MALRIVTALVYFVHQNEEGRELLSALDLKRPTIDTLQFAANEGDSELTKKMLKDCCEYLSI